MLADTPPLKVTWELLPDDYVLPDDPVDNTDQPVLAAALTDSLDLANRLPETALVFSNYAVCATVNDRLVIKAPDWGYVADLAVPRSEVNRSYTPQLQGGTLAIVMEFLSATEGGEYSIKATHPPGKYFFYDRVLQVPNYAIFEPTVGTLELYRHSEAGYRLQAADEQQRYWIPELNLFLGFGRELGPTAPATGCAGGISRVTCCSGGQSGWRRNSNEPSKNGSGPSKNGSGPSKNGSGPIYWQPSSEQRGSSQESEVGACLLSACTKIELCGT